MAKNPMTREQRRDAAHTVRAGAAVSDELMIDASGRLAAPGMPLPLSDNEWSDIQYFADHERLPFGSVLRPARELYGLCGARRVPDWMIPELEAAQARRAGRPVPTAAGAAAAAVVEVEDDEEDQEEGQEGEEQAEGWAEIEEDDPLVSALRDLPMPEQVLEELEPPAAGASAHQRAAHERNVALRACLTLDGKRIELEDERAQLQQANVAAMAEVGGEQHAAALEELATVGLSRQARQAGIELGLRGLWGKRAAEQARFVEACRAMREAIEAKHRTECEALLKEAMGEWHRFRDVMLKLCAKLEAAGGSDGRKALLDIMSAMGPRMWKDVVERGYGRCDPTISPDYEPEADRVGPHCEAVLRRFASRQAQRTCDLVEEQANESWLIVPDAQSWLASLTSDAYRRGRREVERKRAERSAAPPKEAA